MQISANNPSIVSPYQKTEGKIAPITPPHAAHNDDLGNRNNYDPQKYELIPENYSTEFLLSLYEMKSLVPPEFVIDTYTQNK